MRSAVVCSAILATAAAPAAPAAQVAWTVHSPPAGPEPRKYATMVWDSVRDHILMFGGQLDLTRYFNDTWSWDGSRWTQIVTSLAPLEREDHMMAFDRIRGRAVMFGGHDINVVFLNDTWEFDGRDWVRMTPARSPSPRAYGAMAFDERRGLTIFFGGLDSRRIETAETWEWDGIDWRQRFTHRSPSARAEHAMAYDPLRQQVVLYGGRTNFGWSAETWSYDGLDWHPIQVTGPSLTDHRMTYDRARDRLVIWGGRGQPADHSWELPHGETAWVQRPLQGTLPTARNAHTMAFDEKSRVSVMFGGTDGAGPLGDTATYGPTHPARIGGFGDGCPGSVGTATLRPVGDTAPWLGETMVIDLRPLPPNQPAVLFIGFSDAIWRGLPLPLELGVIGMPGCKMLTSTDLFLAMQLAGGVARSSLRVPIDTNLPGFSLFLQGFIRDPAANALGFVTSDAVRADIGAK